MKKIGVLAVVMAMAFLFVGVASAEMYVEGYIGGAGAMNNLGESRSLHRDNSNGLSISGQVNVSGAPDLTVIGGVKLGTWFVKEGTLGWSGYPDWAKYFGFYTDFSYHNVVLRPQRVGGTIFVGNNTGRTINGIPNGGTVAQNVAGTFNAEGSVPNWAFMFAARYGFFQDSEVPFGRLQPYIAVGPAILFTSLKPKVNIFGVGGGGNGADVGFSPGSQSSTTVALQAEGGVRFYALKNVSFDISFKYDALAQPTYTYNGNSTIVFPNGITGSNPVSLKMNPVLDLFSFQAGVAYHF
jgi:hypothetical protein